MDHKIVQIVSPVAKDRSSQQAQKGYVLLAVMLLITLMLIAMSVELPRIAQQVKRDKEEELVHRGMDYARAVKRFYHKSNTYPNSIEQLKDTYARSSSPEEQKKLAADIQKEAYDQVIYVPLGQFLIPSAWRKSLTGVLDGPATPIFWNIDKSE